MRVGLINNLNLPQVKNGPTHVKIIQKHLNQGLTVIAQSLSPQIVTNLSYYMAFRELNDLIPSATAKAIEEASIRQEILLVSEISLEEKYLADLLNYYLQRGLIQLIIVSKKARPEFKHELATRYKTVYLVT